MSHFVLPSYNGETACVCAGRVALVSEQPFRCAPFRCVSLRTVAPRSAAFVERAIEEEACEG